MIAQQESTSFDIDQVFPPTAPPRARFGQPIYQESCAPCHGETGLGDGPTAADLPVPAAVFADPDIVWERPPAELFHTTKFGRIENLMPPWGNRLDDEQLWRVTAYAWSLHTSEEEVHRGEALYATECAACHGQNGAGDGPDAADVMPDFSDLEYAMALSQADWLAGWQESHPEIGDGWTETDQRAVLETIRTFSYEPPWAPAYHPGPGAVDGQVIQGTADGAAIDGVEVLLQTFLGFEPVAVFTTTVDADGRFHFDDLDVDAELVYLATTVWDGVNYTSPLVRFEADAIEQSTELTVYEVTDDPSALTIDRAHWIVDMQPGALIVGQIMQVGNGSDRTFVGSQIDGVDEPVTVRIWTPEGAQEVGFENGVLGGRFQQEGNWVYDTAPVAPGVATHQIVIRYALPFQGTSLTLPQEFAFPVGSLNLLVADVPGLTADVDGMQAGGIQDVQGNAYRLWQGEDLAQTMAVTLTGLIAADGVDPRAVDAEGATSNAGVATSPSDTLVSWFPWLMGGSLALVLAGVFVWSWQKGLVSAGDAANELRRQQERLVDEIAYLDDLHVLGDLDDSEWQHERSELKAQLLSVAVRLNQTTGA